MDCTILYYAKKKDVETFILIITHNLTKKRRAHKKWPKSTERQTKESRDFPHRVAFVVERSAENVNIRRGVQFQNICDINDLRIFSYKILQIYSLIYFMQVTLGQSYSGQCLSLKNLFSRIFFLLFHFQYTYKFFNVYLKKNKRIKIKKQPKKINTVEVIFKIILKIKKIISRQD